MVFHWSAARTAAFRDPYLDWSRMLAKRLEALPPLRPDTATEYEPIFVRLVGSDVTAARLALHQAVQGSPTLLMDPHEADALKGRIDDPEHLADLPDEYALYRRVGTPDADHADLFQVLDCGVPIRLEDSPPHQAAAPLSLPHRPPSGTPIVAIIDDGIGFLNQRFRRGTSTRFHAIWLQSLESQSARGGILAGQVLDHGTINDLLASASSEAELYAQINGSGFGPVTHGSHVLDLAAGADPNSDDPVTDWPLLAVQLPPEAVEDTAGIWFESYILQGLRWTLRQAACIDPAAPVIVNLSLGIAAGPKDGSRFAEMQLAREARNWEAVTGQPVRLVWSFGNGYRADLCAHWQRPVPTAEPVQIVTRLLPDDGTASYVEIHLRGAASSSLSLSITAPDGTASGPTTLPLGALRSLEDAHGRAVARLYHQPARDHGNGITEPAHYLLALAPTRPRKPTEPTAPPGAWTIAASQNAPHPDGADDTANSPTELLMQIQRDDALRRSYAGGRQAYFDDPASYGWERRTSDYTRPLDTGPVTRKGSHNALITAPSRQVVTVGAAMFSGQVAGKRPENFQPALYSAAGSVWSVTGPTVSAAVENGAFSDGIRASGTVSGTQRRSSGTSAAAGVITRALALSCARITANAQRPDSTQSEDFDPAVLDLYAVAPDMADRMGAYVVVPLPATRQGPATTS